MNLIKYTRKQIRESKFGKSIALIAGGTAFAQALGILFSPIITRIYPPEQYGVLTSYSAVLGLLAISASLDYQKAIPIAEDDEKAINLLVLSFLSLLAVGTIVLIGFTLFGDYILRLFDNEILSSYKYFIPFGVFFVGAYNIVLQWAFRDRNYKSVMRTKISRSIASNITKVILGLMKLGPIGLILGFIIGQSAGITSLAAPVIKKKELLAAVNLKQLKYVLKRYKKFPIYSAPSNYIHTAGNNIPIVLLASWFGSSATGLFGLANTIVRLPMGLIGSSVAQVFYSETAKIGKTDPIRIKSSALNLIKKLAFIAFIPIIIILLFGPWLFSVVFGSQWYEAGIYARSISVMVYFDFVVSPLGRILEVFERQREGFLFNSVRLGMVLVAFFLAKTFRLNSYGTVMLYSIISAIIYILLFFMVKKIMNLEIKHALNSNKQI